MTAPSAPVAADRDHERRGTPPERLVRQLPDHGVACATFAPAAPTPLIGLNHAASQQCSVRPESLTGDLKAEFVEAAEGSQISAGEAGADGSVVHVEVFQMAV